MKNRFPAVRATIMAMGVLACAASAGPVAAAPDDCDRACLKDHVDQVLAGLLHHDASSLPLAEHYRSIFNGKPDKPGEGEIWRVIDKIDFHQYVPDPKSGQIAFFGVAEQDRKRGTLFLRLAVAHGKLTDIELIAGNRILGGVPGLISPNPFYDYVLPPAQRRTREQLIAIADSYFQGLQVHDGSKVPVSADCRRFEDGVQTSLNAVFMPLPCNGLQPFTYMDATANRMYPVVDVERGLVVGQMVIQVSKAAGPPSAPPPSSAAEKSAAAAAVAATEANVAAGMIMPFNEFRNKPHDTIIHELFKIVDGRIIEIQTIRLDRPYGWGGGW